MIGHVLGRLWTAGSLLFGIGALVAAWIAFSEWKTIGDMMFTYGWNSLIAACFWFWQAFRTDT